MFALPYNQPPTLTFFVCLFVYLFVFFVFFCLSMSFVYEMEKCLKIYSHKHQFWWTTHYLNDNWIANWLIKTTCAIQAPLCLFVFKISELFHNLYNYSEIYRVFYVRKNVRSNISCNLLLSKYERNYNNALFIYYPLANEVAKGYSNATVRPSFRIILVNTIINILQWILTKLGTYLVLKRIWSPIDFQGHRSKVKVTGSNL